MQGRGRRARGAALVGVLATLVLVGSAGAARVGGQPAEVRVGDLDLTGYLNFRPSALPKDEFAPGALTLAGSVRSVSGTHPPPLEELRLKTDENVAIDVRGHPVCRTGPIHSMDIREAKRICRKEIVGRGSMKVQIQFPDSSPVEVVSDLVVLNGGVKGRLTTLFVHAYITVPVPAAIVTTVKISRIKSGRHGLRWVVTVPRIAGGSGSITDFRIEIDKRFRYKGKGASVVGLRCRGGTVRARATAIFDGTPAIRAPLDLTRPCTPRV